MSVTSSPRDTRYLQQTCAWHLAANPGISGCEEGGRWSPARLGPPGCSAARGPGTLWVVRDPWGHQSSWVPSETTSKDYPAAPRGIPTRDVPWVINPSGAPGKAPVLSADSRELGSIPCFPRQPFPVAGRVFSGNPVTSMSGPCPCKEGGGAGTLRGWEALPKLLDPEEPLSPPGHDWEPKNCSQGGCSWARPSRATPQGDGLRHPRAARSAWLPLAPPKSQQGAHARQREGWKERRKSPVSSSKSPS